MSANARTGEPNPHGKRRAGWLVTNKQKAGAAEHCARLAEIRRRFTLQVIATDHEGNEILNLTRVALAQNLPNESLTVLKIHDVLELLIEAAGEWG
jgi:hypothetical protein